MHAQLVRPAYTAVLHAPLQHLTRSRSLHQHHQLSLTCTPHTMATAAAAAAQPATSPPSDPIVQYVVVRRDLWTAQGWPLGPVVAQACHAAVAAIVQELQDPLTQAYTAAAALDHMHKVVLEVKSEQQLRTLSDKLTEAGVRHKLWVEQPENYPTCLATKPYHRSTVGAHFKKLQLCKAAVGQLNGAASSSQ